MIIIRGSEMAKCKYPKHPAYGIPGDCCDICDLYEAEDRIVKLEKALREIAYGYKGFNRSALELREIAEQALKENEC
jgi:hypothetical protein